MSTRTDLPPPPACRQYPACVELFCIAFYVYRCIHLLSFTSHGWFWKDVKNLAVISVILVRRAWGEF